MSKLGLTKINHEHLEFVFDHKQHKVFIRDHMFRKEYEIKPQCEESLPILIILTRYLEN